MNRAIARPRSGTRRKALAAALALAALVVAAWSPHAAAEAGKGEPAARPANIDRNGVIILVRSALAALDHANKTNNYAVLRALGAPGFQSNSAEKLAEIFASQRRDGLDLAGTAAIEPQLTVLPQITPNGMLHMAGFFPSAPRQVAFEFLFQAVEGQWRLFGISVGLVPAVPVAPGAAAMPEAERVKAAHQSLPQGKAVP